MGRILNLKKSWVLLSAISHEVLCFFFEMTVQLGNYSKHIWFPFGKIKKSKKPRSFIKSGKLSNPWFSKLHLFEGIQFYLTRYGVDNRSRNLDWDVRNLIFWIVVWEIDRCSNFKALKYFHIFLPWRPSFRLLLSVRWFLGIFESYEDIKIPF